MESDVLQIFLSIFTEVKFGVGDRIGRYSSVIYSENSIEPIALNRIQSDKFPVGQELYTDWIEKNRVRLDYTHVTDLQYYTVLEYEEFLKYSEKYDSWSVWYQIGLPGLSPDRNQALIQVSALCTAGPPNYSELQLLTRKESGGWKVDSRYGIYNQ
ncbi:MAG: hypothetical protein H7A24_15805 [Leptospiraceae bacterium]|nr:hypothetical protein [Leptospiraceae bacterium]MCP5513352.1 hypothetical protein [Leptospiraceae bacterium]